MSNVFGKIGESRHTSHEQHDILFSHSHSHSHYSSAHFGLTALIQPSSSWLLRLDFISLARQEHAILERASSSFTSSRLRGGPRLVLGIVVPLRSTRNKTAEAIKFHPALTCTQRQDSHLCHTEDHSEPISSVSNSLDYHNDCLCTFYSHTLSSCRQLPLKPRILLSHSSSLLDLPLSESYLINTLAHGATDIH